MEKQKRVPATAAKQRYNEKTYDRLYVTVKKGQKEAIETAATAQGLSLNAFIVQAIEKAMEKAQK